jgi:hypothetical protein
MRLRNLHRSRLPELPPLVGHADDGDVDVENVHDRLRDRVESRIERQTLRERTRDLVQRAHAPRRRTFGFEGALTFFAEQLCALVELRVLHRNRKLHCECREERGLVLRQDPRCGWIDSEQADYLVLREQRHGDRSFDSGLRRSVADSRKARIGPDVANDEHAA